MNLDKKEITYNVNKLYDLTIEIFKDELKNTTVSYLKNEATLFSFYEDNISSPIDEGKDKVSVEREDFYEVISILSWAMYRVWINCVLVNNIPADDLSCIDKDKVIKLFLDNLNCEEGIDLYEKVMGV